METLHCSVTGGIDVESIEVVEGYEQPSARCSITTPDYGGLDLGDEITVDLGFDTSHGTIFKGYIQSINSERLPGHHIIEATDILIRAAEHMIVSTDLDNPFRRWNITAEDLVGDLLAEAGIVNYEGDATGFTIATGEIPAEFQLVSSWDAAQQVANIVAWHIYADQTGKVWFQNILPEPTGAASHAFTTGNTGNILVIRHSRSTDNLRNKVVVFGYPPITASAAAASPYLPAGFYKTAIVSSVLIDQQYMADGCATYNLAKWNKLTEVLSVEAIGDYSVHARDTVSVTEAFTGVAGDWFVRDASHSFGPTSYTMRLTLVK
jgi:hypothetical protein